MRIGLILGTFDPIHIGHLNIASTVLNEGKVDKVLFVPTMQNLFKERKATDFYKRCSMISAAIKGMENCELCSIDHLSSPPYYSYNTLALIKDIYKEEELYLILGSDVLQTFSEWEKSEWIQSQVKIIEVYRPGYISTTSLPGSSLVVGDFLISSTKIRELIRKKKEIIPLVPTSVKTIIKNYKLYEN